MNSARTRALAVHWELPSQMLEGPLALTVGTFDGVHCGHQRLVNELVGAARAGGMVAAALTFVDMPLCFLRPDDCPRLLTLAEEKVAAFAATELDHLFIVPFDAALASQSARQFMGFWRERCGLELFVAGPDFALGRERAGDIPQLTALGRELDFTVQALHGKTVDEGLPISSTRCRQTVEAGDVAAAARLLGRPFAVEGEVVPGQQLGRTIGFPTLNLRVNGRKVLPAHGVYAVKASWPGQASVAAVLNLGVRPTVAGAGAAVVTEFHVLDAKIGEPPPRARVEFVARLRAEQRFAGLAELQAQIARDVAAAREILGAS